MPHLAKLYDEFKEKGLAVVTVSKDDDPSDAARFIAKYKYSWLNVADPEWESDGDWGDSAIPRLVLIEKDSKVLFESLGFDDVQEAKIRGALHKMDATFPAVDGKQKLGPLYGPLRSSDLYCQKIAISLIYCGSK